MCVCNLTRLAYRWGEHLTLIPASLNLQRRLDASLNLPDKYNTTPPTRYFRGVEPICMDTITLAGVSDENNTVYVTVVGTSFVCTVQRRCLRPLPEYNTA